jgi:hypothetical protein
MQATLGLLAFGVTVATSGCEHGMTGYTSEASAQAACPGDEVVKFWPGHGNQFYVTKASSFWLWKDYQQSYACLAEMERMRVPCGANHNVDEGPLPESLNPSCYNVPGKPKA